MKYFLRPSRGCEDVARLYMIGVTPGTLVKTVFTGMPRYDEQKEDAVGPACCRARRTSSELQAALLSS